MLCFIFSGHCGARVYLEGVWPAPVAPASVDSAASSPPAPTTAATPPPGPVAKRQRFASEIVSERASAKGLLDAKLLTQADFDNLKNRLLQGE